jgi:hypothetical protein
MNRNYVHSRAHPATPVHARLLDIRWRAESILSHRVIEIIGAP